MEIKPDDSEFKGMGVVRNIETGKPVFSTEEGVRMFWDVLSDEDKAYLREQFNLKDL